MNEKEFKRKILGEFIPDNREKALHERLRDYYRTTEKMDNHYASNHWSLFKRWCDDRGYTREEINRAKRSGIR